MSVDSLAAHPLRPKAVQGGTGANWFLSRRYDLFLILGVFGISLALGAIGLISAAAFRVVLLLDIWLLAYPHVASTYTRVVFDRANRRRYWPLVTILPVVALVGTVGVTWGGGTVALFTLYYFWQAWHYTRQSYGIGRSLGRNGRSTLADGSSNGSRLLCNDRLSTALVYATPLWGLLHRAAQRPATFYGFPIVFPPVPVAVAHSLGAVVATMFVVWCWQRRRPWGSATSHHLFVLSHVAITVVSYVLVADITKGWLFVNIWHNLQYFVFVWAANRRRFRDGFDGAAPFLSRLSQPGNVLKYVLLCSALGWSGYTLLNQATGLLVPTFASAVLVVNLAVNFHHYLVDAVIWRRRAVPKP